MFENQENYRSFRSRLQTMRNKVHFLEAEKLRPFARPVTTISRCPRPSTSRRESPAVSVSSTPRSVSPVNTPRIDLSLRARVRPDSPDSSEDEMEQLAILESITTSRTSTTATRVPSHIDIDPSTLFLHQEAINSLNSRLHLNYVLRDQTESEVSPIYLVRDFEAAKMILGRMGISNRDRYRINSSFLSADPFLQFHNIDYDVLYPEAVSEMEWEHEIFRTLAMQLEDSALRRDLWKTLIRTNPDDDDSADMKQTKQLVRKRIKRLFEKALSDGTSQMRELALHLISNSGRCLDGLQDGLVQIEAMVFRLDQPQNFGDFISRVLTDYKMDFIRRHAFLNPNSAEFQTTSVQTLRNRMLYSLGLKGQESQVSYLYLGDPDDAALQPAQVMERFLRGGEARLQGGLARVRFDAYTVEKMIDLLMTAHERSFVNGTGMRISRASPKPHLKGSLFQQFCMDDPVLSGPYENVAVTFEEEKNHFFEKAAEGQNAANIQVSREFWLYLLQKYGYVLKN